MSTNSPNEILNFSDWGSLNNDILLAIFEKLDNKSLFNSMCVNRYWRSVGIYHCNHYKKWGKLVEVSTNNEYSIIKETSKLHDKHVVLNALQWYSVKCATVRLSHWYGFVKVKNISVYNDYLLVVTSHGVEYHNLQTRRWKKTVPSSSNQRIETASIIVEVAPLGGFRAGCYKLTVTNKLHYSKCKCVRSIITKKFSDVFLWKVIGKEIHTIDSGNNVRRYAVDKCKWEKSKGKVTICHRYRYPEPISGWQIKNEGIYILKKDFTIYNGYLYGFGYENVYKFNIPSYDLYTKPYIFNTYSAICAVPSEENFKIHVKEDGKELVVACPGYTCAKEHGHMIFVGYENGKIQIFRTAHLLEKSKTPELQFNLQNFTKPLTNEIIALDIYESEDCLNVIAATKFNVYQFSISDISDISDISED